MAIGFGEVPEQPADETRVRIDAAVGTEGSFEDLVELLLGDLRRNVVRAPSLQGFEPDRRTAQQLEEIIVTAQRREESMQDVPISITVLSQESITQANITNSSDLAIYTPSLKANSRFGNENATFTIRGFTQDLRTTASVATYFAEVVAPRGQSSQSSGDGAGPGSLFDLQNVQVLKGPQGTLF